MTERIYKPDDKEHVAIAIALIRQAHLYLRKAGAKRAARRLSTALKSAEGARRNVVCHLIGQSA